MNKREKTPEQPKRYWQTLDERTAPPELPSWITPEFEKSRNEMRDESDAELKDGVSRKDFLKFMGTGAVLLGAACRRPTEQIVPAVIQPAEQIPGESSYYSTTAPDGTGLIVRTREGRPVKIAGNPEHPLTRGGVSAYHVASIMDLYDPDRLRQAAKLKSGVKKNATDDDVLGDMKTALAKGSYVLLTGPINSPSTHALLQEFLRAVPGGRHLELNQDPTLRQIAEGQRAGFGQAMVPSYRFDRAEYILAVDADFLGSMPGAPGAAARFGQMRDLRHGAKRMSRLVMFESMFSNTGANADDRYSIRPGDQAAVALAIAAELILKQGRGGLGGNGSVRRALEPYQADRLVQTLKHTDGLFKAGTFEPIVTKIASELWENRGKSLVIAGSPLVGPDAAPLAAAVNLLNAALENDGRTVDYVNPVQLALGASDDEIAGLVRDMADGRVKTLIVAGANPVFHLPPTSRFVDALKKVANVFSLNDRVDETTAMAQAVLPTSHYLESWGDCEAVPGFYSIRQPVVRPLFTTESFEDRLIHLSGGTLGGAKSFHEFLKEKWKAVQARSGAGGEFRAFWQSALQAGYFAPGMGTWNGARSGRNFNTSALDVVQGPEALASSKPFEKELKLGLYYKPAILDGSGANNAYRQELPDPVTKNVWANYLAILPATARKLKLKQGSVVQVKTAGGAIKIPVHLQVGLHPGSAVVALGYGRTAAGSVGNDHGVNAIALASAEKNRITFSGVTAVIEATGERENISTTQQVFRNGFNAEDRAFFAPGKLPDAPFDASSQKVLFHERPIILESTLTEYLKDPSKVHPDKSKYPVKDKASLMPTWVDEKDIRWHMVVDLNACVGCGACVTSCDLENNVPMVGPEQVSRSREMHWIRIDRYFSGNEENPDVAFQPMLCQQCENAPCENVCPVAATTHSHEGLNVMTYNRCIGTRYCANNCPYKVRRFNYFEYWNWWDGLDRKLKSPMQLGLNPDVGVRVRGVMEKCTFCIHRIAGPRQEMRARGDKRIQDGVVRTACQEVCPTHAISFGDIHDKTSDVSRLAADARGYKVLDFLGVGPSITYLAKIRNRS